MESFKEVVENRIKYLKKHAVDADPRTKEGIWHRLDELSNLSTKFERGRVRVSSECNNVLSCRIKRCGDIIKFKDGDIDKFKELWNKRNPCHEINQTSGKDMFWDTAEIVAIEYCNWTIEKVKGANKVEER